MSEDEPPSDAIADAVALLERCPAFSGVPPHELERLAARAEIAYVPAGRHDAELAGTPFVVQRGALLVYDETGRSVDLVGEAQFYAPSTGADLEALEPTLALALPEASLDVAWSRPRAATGAASVIEPTVDPHTAHVAEVMTRELLTIRPEETARTAAERMRAHGVSSLLVFGETSEEQGIVTDRDLRNRLVAEGAAPNTPVGAIATFPVRTIPASTPAFEALVTMLESGIHHLPVVDDAEIVGMLTSSDLLMLGTRSPLYLRKALGRADCVEDAATVMATLPNAVRALLDAGTTPTDAARVIAAVRDRLVLRLLALAEEALGPAPAPFGVLLFGSQARREPALGSDQDTGLLLESGLDAATSEWFASLGGWLTDALEQCGQPRCPGGVMASQPEWRADAAGWAARFERWARAPTPEHLLGADIAFDARTVAGGLDADATLRPAIIAAGRSGLLLGSMAQKAAGHRVPLGFRGKLTVDRSGEHAGHLNIKARALGPVTELARLFALAAGSTALTTDERLAAGAEAGLLSSELAATLTEGYASAVGLRLDAHLAALHAGVEPTDWIDPSALAPFTRARLRETFGAVRTAQDAAVARFAGGRLN